ncbi:MAG: hypothetical protein DRP78_01675 [Candidatus Omnitrophota bacterium]|nr:MAG: hypothetical protein DRP78_01675 [Candidatus Omnitrophota bacterium]
MKHKKQDLPTKEYTGNSVEQAIEEALTDLKLPKEKVKIQILTEGQKGLFGMHGAKKAKIKVSVLSCGNK